MPSTHHVLLDHVVFSTKDRHPWIRLEWRERLHGYIGGVLRDLGGVPECVGGTADHVHLLAGLKPAHCISDVVRDVKKASSRWVHETIGLTCFAWQDGYGVFSVGSDRRDSVRSYIRNQEEHHRSGTFQEEYLRFLRTAGVDFDERYLW